MILKHGDAEVLQSLELVVIRRIPRFRPEKGLDGGLASLLDVTIHDSRGVIERCDWDAFRALYSQRFN